MPVEKTKKADLAKAKKIKALLKKGEFKKHSKFHSGVRFLRPKTLIKKRQPKYIKFASSLVQRPSRMDMYSIIQSPIATEKATRKMENENTMVFYVSPKANKIQIKNAFQKLYNVKIRSINVMMTPQGQKKAYIRLSGESDSLTLANTIGII